MFKNQGKNMILGYFPQSLIQNASYEVSYTDVVGEILVKSP